MSIKYTVDVDNKFKHLFGSFAWWIKSTLTNKTRGISHISGIKYVKVDDEQEADIIARLVPQWRINERCGFENLSCSIRADHPRTDPDEILFSFENWNGASDFKGSISDYRTYVINHEFLHCRPFYLNHPDAKKISLRCQRKSNLPVMYQQSRGLVGKCKHNPWPTKTELAKANLVLHE